MARGLKADFVGSVKLAHLLLPLPLSLFFEPPLLFQSAFQFFPQTLAFGRFGLVLVVIRLEPLPGLFLPPLALIFLVLFPEVFYSFDFREARPGVRNRTFAGLLLLTLLFGALSFMLAPLAIELDLKKTAFLCLLLRALTRSLLLKCGLGASGFLFLKLCLGSLLFLEGLGLCRFLPLKLLQLGDFPLLEFGLCSLFLLQRFGLCRFLALKLLLLGGFPLLEFGLCRLLSLCAPEFSHDCRPTPNPARRGRHERAAREAVLLPFVRIQIISKPASGPGEGSIL